jgi:HEAT repeat protein
MSGNWKWFCEEIKQQGKDGSWAVPVLIDILNEAENGWAVATACTVLEKIGSPEGLEAVPHLLQALERPEGHVKRYVARALFMLRAEPARVLPALRRHRDAVSGSHEKSWLAEAIRGLEAVEGGRDPGVWRIRK